MLIPMSNCKVLCDNTKNGFLRLQDTLGVYHVQVLKPVSFQQQITKTPFQIRLATVRYFCRKITLGVYHVQVLKPVSFKQQITKTPFQIRLATVRYFCHKIIEIEHLPSWVAILVSNVPSLGMSIKCKSLILTILYSDFVTNSYGESRNSFCEKSWVPVEKNKRVQNWKYLGLYVTRQLNWRQTPKLFTTV